MTVGPAGQQPGQQQHQPEGADSHILAELAHLSSMDLAAAAAATTRQRSPGRTLAVDAGPAHVRDASPLHDHQHGSPEAAAAVLRAVHKQTSASR